MNNEQNVICGCGGAVEPERVSLLSSRICSSCAQQTQKNWQKPKGVMIYGHKTGAEIQVLTPDQFTNHRKYNPFGRNTGRGSGLHRVTRTTSCM